MRLRRIAIRNFMPYRGDQEILFPQGEANVVVVYGDNMRGKTSLLNAIRFAFFGKATARHLREIDRLSLFNREAAAQGDWTLSVTVDFDHAGSDYRITRKLEPASQVARPQAASDLREVFVVRKDGVTLTGEDRLLEMNQVLPEGIARFFLFDGELLQEYEVLVRDPDKAEKIKEAIEAVLGVPAITRGHSNIQSLLAEAQRSQAEDLKHSRTLKAQAEQQITYQAQLEKARKDQAANEKKRNEYETIISDLAEKLQSVSKAMELEVELLKVQERIRAAPDRVRTQRLRRADLLQDAWISLLEPRVQALRRNLEDDRNTLMSRFTDRATKLARSRDLQATLDQRLCALCGTSLDGEHANHVAAELGELTALLRAAPQEMAQLEALQARMAVLGRLRGPKLGDRVAAIERDMRALAVEITDLRARENELKAMLQGFKSDDAERVRSEREQMITLLGSLKRDMDVKAAEILNIQRKLDQVSRLMSKNPEARQQRSSRAVAVYGTLDRIFAASIDRLRDRQRERVEAYASEAFRRLTSERDYESLDINDNYGLTIRDKSGRLVDERSAGAEQIVALSLIDGLNRAGRRGGPIVMDTPFGRLDWHHRRNVLSYLPDMAEQVLLLVHEGEMDPDRDLPALSDRIGAVYRILRGDSAMESRIVQEGVPGE